MGFFHFSKKQPLSGLFRGFTDWHCHILPGVDDGFSKMEDSLRVLSLYEEAGISEVWCTPHIMEDIPNTVPALRNRFAELTEAYKGSVELHLAAENMLDSLFEERLENGDLLPLGDGRLLVETSYYNPPIRFKDMLRRIKQLGYEPVLAHPERYRYMGESDYRSLFGDGIRFQLNLPSLTGYYGSTARSKAEWMLENEMYTLMATDLHHYAGFENLMKEQLPDKTMERLRHLL